MNHSMPGLPVHYQLPESTQTHVHWVSDVIQPFHPLSSPSPPSLNLSQHQGLFKRVSCLIRWPKYWSFSFNISSSNGHPGLISFRMGWVDLPAVQGTLKSLLLTLQLSQPYMTTGKTTALTRWTFVCLRHSLMSKIWGRKWKPIPAFLPGEAHGQRILAGYSPCGHKSRTKPSD